jgi:hypothetical protein
MNNMESRLLAVTTFLKEILETYLSCHVVLKLTVGWMA